LVAKRVWVLIYVHVHLCTCLYLNCWKSRVNSFPWRQRTMSPFLTLSFLDLHLEPASAWKVYNCISKLLRHSAPSWCLSPLSALLSVQACPSATILPMSWAKAFSHGSWLISHIAVILMVCVR